jgi:uncharacterized membrane protein
VRGRSKVVAFTSLGAALYAVGAYATSYVQSPWGMGQFRPAVIVPSVFAVLFGPLVGGLSAALGTLVADSLKHVTLYVPSLVAAVPSNFAAFYLLGKLLEGRFRWPRFIASSLLALAVGNGACAALYALYKAAVGAIPAQLAPGLAVGLTVWWFSTMLPFQLLAVPPILKALARALPQLVPEDVRRECAEGVTPRRELALALSLTGALAASVALLAALSQQAASFFVGGLPAAARDVVRSLIVAMFSVTATALLAAGAFVALRKRGARYTF